MKIGVIGGGPGGLYFGLLIKKQRPAFEVDVFEQNAADATYGFGVGLQAKSWNFLRADDAACLDDILAHAHLFHGQMIGHKGQRIHFPMRQPNAGISRLTLLQVLRDHAERAGVRLHHGDRINDLDAFADCDLVVGADGVNSMVRSAHDAEFGTTRRTLTSRVAWYGTPRVFETSQLIFKKTGHGYFWSVGYPHDQNSSTFVAECEAKAFEAAGLGAMTIDEQVAFTEELFAEELQGCRIAHNNSVWRALPVIRVRNWSVGNRVLLGDALHSPHPSIGSGTRLSMDDAAALAGSLDEHPTDIARALAAYRAAREPIKLKLVDAMERSLEWYETIGERLDGLDPVQLVFDYMARTGRMDLERMRKVAPEFMARYGSLAPAQV